MNRALSRAVLICLVLGLAACSNDPSAAPESQQPATTDAAPEPQQPATTDAAPEPQQPTTTAVTPLEALPSGDEPVALEADTYLVEADAVGDDTSMVTYAVTVPEGWTADSGSDLKKHAETPQGIDVTPWAIEEIGVYGDACHGELGNPGPPPASAEEFVAALRAQGSGPMVSDPVATTVGGLPATRIDLDYPDPEALADCRIGTGQLQVWGTYFVFFPNHTTSVYVVDVEGSPQVFVVTMADGSSAADRAEAQAILDSVSFEPVE